MEAATKTEAAQARMEAVAEAATTLSAFQGAVQNLGAPAPCGVACPTSDDQST